MCGGGKIQEGQRRKKKKKKWWNNFVDVFVGALDVRLPRLLRTLSSWFRKKKFFSPHPFFFSLSWKKHLWGHFFFCRQVTQHKSVRTSSKIFILSYPHWIEKKIIIIIFLLFSGQWRRIIKKDMYIFNNLKIKILWPSSFGFFFFFEVTRG